MNSPLKTTGREASPSPIKHLGGPPESKPKPVTQIGQTPNYLYASTTTDIIKRGEHNKDPIALKT